MSYHLHNLFSLHFILNAIQFNSNYRNAHTPHIKHLKRGNCKACNIFSLHFFTRNCTCIMCVCLRLCFFFHFKELKKKRTKLFSSDLKIDRNGVWLSNVQNIDGYTLLIPTHEHTYTQVNWRDIFGHGIKKLKEKYDKNQKISIYSKILLNQSSNINFFFDAYLFPVTHIPSFSLCVSLV